MTTDDTYVILGVSSSRTDWFTQVGAWAAGGGAPIEYVRCLGVAEAIARLRGGAPVSAVLADAATPGLERDLAPACARSDAALITVADPRAATPAGGDVTLPPNFGLEELLATLASASRPVRWRTLRHAADVAPPPPAVRFRGHLTAVCSRGAAGGTVLAMALAQGLAATDLGHGSVALADLTRNADLACYHDALDVVPGLQELVEAHAAGEVAVSTVRSMLHEVPDRGYALLLGLRRPHDWVALGTPGTGRTIDGLRAAFRHVVADVTADFEGEELSGSIDVEERNALARTAVTTADTVVAAGRSGLKGTRDLVRLLDDLTSLGVPSDRILTVVTDAPRDRAARAEVTRALAALATSPPDASPIFVPHRRSLEATLRCADPLPAGLCEPVTRAVLALGDRTEPDATADDAPAPEPIPAVAP